MKKKILLLLAGCLISTNVLAGISVFPQAVDFLDNSRKRSQTLNIVNQSEKIQTYRVSVVEYTQDENGKYVKADSVANSAQKYLIYSPKQFTLAPGKVQSIRIARRGGNDIPDGEYVSHLVVSEVFMGGVKNEEEEKADELKDAPKNQNNMQGFSVSIHTLFSVSVPVTIYKGKELYQETDVLSAHQSGDKLDLVLQRKGNVSSRFNLVVRDAKGGEVGRAGPVRIYMPNGRRKLSVELKSGTKPVRLELYDALTEEKIAEKAI